MSLGPLVKLPISIRFVCHVYIFVHLIYHYLNMIILLILNRYWDKERLMPQICVIGYIFIMVFIISYFQEFVSKLHYHMDNAKDIINLFPLLSFLIWGPHIFSWQYYFLSIPINSHPLILRAWLGCYTHFLRRYLFKWSVRHKALNSMPAKNLYW